MRIRNCGGIVVHHFPILEANLPNIELLTSWVSHAEVEENP